MKMKRIIAILAGCVLTAGLFSGFTTKAAGSITLRLSDSQPVGYVTVLADNLFAKEVSDATKGRIKIQVYPGSQLGDEKSTIEQLQFGAIDAIRISSSPLAEFNKPLGVLILPYLFKSKDQMFRVLDGKIGDSIFKGLLDAKIVGLCWLDSGARNFYNTKRDVKTPDDLKGLKIRVQESKLMMDMVSALGASPTPMAYGDVYSALQTGVIDGAENNWPSYLTTNHYQVAKHITVDEHTRIPEMIAFSKLTWDKIAPADQVLIRKAAKDAAAYERIVWLQQTQAAIHAIEKKGGVKITYLKSNKAFQDKVQSMYAEHPEYKDMINAINNVK
jgi:tripartite ATP-independent transporter DctP family solute receptor